MSDTLELIIKENRLDSRLLSRMLDYRHQIIIAHIDKYNNELSQLDNLIFTKESKTLDKSITFQNGLTHTGGKEIRFFMLTEDQCYFILTLMRNNEKVIKCKLSLVKAFRQARNYNTEKDIARMEGKKVRKLETDAIQKMIMYAKSQGSKNADRYYTNFTKMTNDILGVEAGHRELLSKDILSKIGMIETIIMLSISDGIARNMDYKDIYKLAKFRVSEIVDISKKYIN